MGHFLKRKNFIRIFFLAAFLLYPRETPVDSAEQQDFFRKAVEAFNHQNFESAYNFYKVVLEEDPGNLEAQSGLLISRINLQESVEEIRMQDAAVLKETPGDYLANYRLGLLFDIRDIPDEAEKYYLNALAEAPAPAAIYVALINLKSEKRPDDPEISQYLESLANVAPESYLHYLGQTSYYLRLAQKETDYESLDSLVNLAAQTALEAQAHRPYSITPYYFLSYCSLMLEDMEKTKDLLTEALSLAPMDSLLHLILATVYMQEENFAEARIHLVMAKKSLTRLDRLSGHDKTIQTQLDMIQVHKKMKPVVLHVASFVILIFSIILHEFMHGWVAYKRGDATAKILGRLSLNPLVHIDLFGSIILPVILILSQAPFLIGWAKPVPVNPANYRNPRKDDALISLGGPAANIFLSLIFAGCLFFLGYYLKIHNYTSFGFGLLGYQTIIAGTQGTDLVLTYMVNIFKYGIMINCVLAGLNLLPIPPLDGSHIVKALLPFAWLDKLFAFFSSSGLIMIAFLAFFGVLNYLLLPALIFAQLLMSSVAYIFGLG